MFSLEYRGSGGNSKSKISSFGTIAFSAFEFEESYRIHM